MPINIDSWEWRLDSGENEIVAEIMEDRIVDYRTFAQQHGLDPRHLFENGSLAGLDFRDTDIRDMSFMGTTLKGAIFTQRQIQDLKSRHYISESGLDDVVCKESIEVGDQLSENESWPTNNPSGIFDKSAEFALDPHCLDTLKQGSEVWNAWCQSDVNIRLVGVNLTGVDLGGYNFSKANISFSNLDGCDLRKTKLSGANLNSSSLKQCSLNGASLKGADLSFADLNGSNLQGVNLTATILYGADLRNVIGLLPRQVDKAKTNESTILPKGFSAKATSSQRTSGGQTEPTLDEQTKPKRKAWWSLGKD